eukprot:5414491-Pleurochrysis_carterae.AAC.2
MHGFKTSVVIDEDEQVLEACVLCAHKGSGDVSMDESSSVRRLVVSRVVRVTCRVRFSAGCAAVKMTTSGRGGSVGSNRRQVAQSSGVSV